MKANGFVYHLLRQFASLVCGGLATLIRSKPFYEAKVGGAACESEVSAKPLFVFLYLY
jgi:hypothetical protein